MIYSTLSNGVTIPGIGFGCYKLPEENGVDVLLSAIQAGYRHFDTASFYGTEKALGQAVRASGLPGRSFSSPPSCGRIRWTTPMAAFRASLQALGTDYLDLYLIHWPRPNPERADWKELDIKVWCCLEELYRQGAVRAIARADVLIVGGTSLVV